MSEPAGGKSGATEPLAAGMRLARRSLVAALLMGAGAYYPAVALAGPASEAKPCTTAGASEAELRTTARAAAGLMAAGLGIALIGAWAGIVPAVAVLGRGPQALAWGSLAGLGVRLGVTAALALIARYAAPSPAVLLIWVGIGQFVLLGVDVAGLIQLLRPVGEARGSA